MESGYNHQHIYDLLRADLVPEAYVPGRDVREARDLVRRRHCMVKLRTMLKNEVPPFSENVFLHVLHLRSSTR